MTVQDAAPTVALPEAPAVPEGTPFQTSATVTDPGVLDTHRAVVDHGEGVRTEAADVVGGTVPVDHVYADNDTYQLLVDVTDDGGGASSASRDVTVANVEPTIESLTGIPIEPVPVGVPMTASAVFSDPGAGDTHTQQWSWGDGSTSETDFAQGPVETTHTYAEAGLYTVEVVVTDDDGAVARRAVEYVVVYDPAGGFATGGGVMESLAGAYQADPSLTGRANSSFKSKYAKGATVPDGNTTFRFQAAGFRFETTDQQWLVVDGSKATFKGTGTVNG